MNVRLGQICYCLFTLLLILFFVHPSEVLSQSVPSSVVVNRVLEPIYNEESVTVGVHLILLDQEERVVDKIPNEVLFTLIEEEEVYTATTSSLAQQASQLHILLALDLSGSMSKNDSVRLMRNSAIQAIDAAPEDTVFHILFFNDVFWIENKSTNLTATGAMQIINTIDDDNAGGGTKLYDAAYESVQYIQRIVSADESQRGVVVLFTDGNDEETAGTGIQYSEKDPRDVIAVAGENVPIYTIGFGRDVSSQLFTFADETGGRNINPQNDRELADGFTDIINSVTQQTVAAAEIFPDSSGEHDILLQVSSGAQSFERRFKVLLERSYDAPGELSDITIEPLVFDEVNNRYKVTLRAGEPTRIGEVNLRVQSGGIERLSQTYSDLNSIYIDAKRLTQADYTIKLTATDTSGQEIRTVDGEVILSTLQFKHDPEIIPIIVNIDAPQFEESQLSFDIESDNSARITQYVVSIFSETNELVLREEFDAEATVPVKLSMSDLNGGKYRILIDSLDENGRTLIETEGEPLTYIPPQRPGFFARIGKGLRENPLIFFAILGLILSLVAYFMIRNLLESQRSGTVNIQNPWKKNAAEEIRPPVHKTELFKGEENYYPNPQTYQEPRNMHSTYGHMSDPNLLNGPKATVSVFQESRRSHAIVIQDFPLIIGRSGSNSELNLLLTKDQTVSKRHAKLSYSGSVLILEDLGSKNGLHLSGQKVARYQIETGQTARVRLSKRTEIIVELD